MTEEDWEAGFGKSVAVFLNGEGIPDRNARGERVVDDSFIMIFNAHDGSIDFTLPHARVRREVGDRARHRDPAAGRAGAGRGPERAHGRGPLAVRAAAGELR